MYVPDHPRANNRGYVLRSRYVVEQDLGRYLEKDEEVHHKNGNKRDDRLRNLEVMSKAEHAREHGYGNPIWIWRGTPVDDKSVIKLRKKGYGYKKIAKELGTPRSSIKSACKRLGV